MPEEQLGAPLQAELRFQSARSDKTYRIALKRARPMRGWVVEFEYGRTGKALRTDMKTLEPVSYEAALAIYEAILREKLAKGYRPIQRAA